jgi:DNA repair protein RadA/Sms
MAKAKTVYACTHCGQVERKWLGKCPGCGGWNTLQEEVEVAATPSKGKGRPPATAQADGPRRATPITEVPADAAPRMSLGLGELDRVLGGGLVEGALTLIGGEPGVGKSTLLLTAAVTLAQRGVRTLYVSAEESVAQTRLRAERLGALHDELFLLGETDLNVVLREVDRLRPRALIVDSVQTVFTPDLPAAPGSVTQVREVTSQVMYLAKGQGISTFLVGHVTKDGNLAGPRTLEHMVDTVLAFEATRAGPFRILRSLKNRFGSTHEIAVFEMMGDGLAAVDNPSALFLAERSSGAPGSVVTCAVEGTRPILVEVQGLAVDAPFGTPRRTTLGVEGSRVALLAAVLERRCGLSLAGQDLFVNVAGGVTITETAADLPVALAIGSSLRNVPVDDGLVCLGEIGLSGEVRSVYRLQDRLREAARLGFTRALVPASNLEKAEPVDGLALLGARTLEEALDIALQQ